MTINVLHFINNLNREGAQVMVANLVTAADDSQINYFVCVRQPGGPMVAELRRQGLRVMEPEQYFGFLSTRQSVGFVKKICRENQIHIIHAHMADAAFLGWLVARSLSLQLVISHHGHDILLKCNPACRFVYYVLLNLAARFAAMNVAVSTSVAERVRQVLRVKQTSVQVISNGVRIPEAAELINKRSRISNLPKSLTIVNVGRLVPLKGQRQLIRAVARLVKDFPDVRLTIVGGGDMKQELKQMAALEKVDCHVEFTGAVDNVTGYLATADIYVSSSESEGMPVAVLEAMAWRLPVVASDIPGNRSVVKQDETGFLYKLNDIDDLVKTIIAVAKNTELASMIAMRARLMVEELYSAHGSEKKHASLYQEILGQTRIGFQNGD